MIKTNMVNSYRNIRVAKYIRLSREDGDDRESESVENQRDIIDNYIQEHEELIEAGEYVDDGYTGTNFNRPGFRRMLKDIEEEKIDCIITKDLSRFGRDHIDTGYYLERYLPTNNIRYIAIGDNVDTLKADGLQFLTFKLSFNDYYAQDISNKIKSVKQRKIEKGEYQAGIPPYGYKKSAEKKNHLIQDEYSSKIVKEIFDMYVNKGMSTIKIADELNKREIEPPAVYLQIPTYMKKKSANPSGKYVWLRAQIGKILRNEVYLGSVVGRKFQKVSHKISKVRCTKKEEHIILENMHEPIINIETWNKAQDKLNGYTKIRERKHDHILKGLVYCGECGNKATLRCREEKRKNGNVWRATYFICSKRNNYSGLCDCKQISANLIEEVVIGKIKEETKKIKFSEDEIKKIYNKAEEEANSINNLYKIKLQEMQKQLKKVESSIEEIYQDKINKLIQVEDFKIIYLKKQKEREKIVKEINKIEDEFKKASNMQSKVDLKEIRQIAEDLLNMKEQNKIVLQELIKKIEFDTNKNIKIQFDFFKIK
ncbi:MAG: recombinase family protein [Clostridium sp.]|nr:recombinase family protein [Clostridium sp.]MEE0128046.1 recombinase family protein [Clostridia bacterium]